MIIKSKLLSAVCMVAPQVFSPTHESTLKFTTQYMVLSDYAFFYICGSTK